MAGLVPAIYVLTGKIQEKTWMPGSSPGMTRVSGDIPQGLLDHLALL